MWNVGCCVRKFVFELFLYEKKHTKNQFIVRQTQIFKLEIEHRVCGVRRKFPTLTWWSNVFISERQLMKDIFSVLYL